jgi:hypothetical protein
LRFQPVVELADPVIARCALLAHAPAMAAAVNRSRVVRARIGLYGRPTP